MAGQQTGTKRSETKRDQFDSRGYSTEVIYSDSNSEQQILLVNWKNETHLPLLYFSASSISYEKKYAEIMIFFSIASMSCGPLTSETDSVSIKKIYNNKENNGKKVL